MIGAVVGDHHPKLTGLPPQDPEPQQPTVGKSPPNPAFRGKRPTEAMLSWKKAHLMILPWKKAHATRSLNLPARTSTKTLCPPPRLRDGAHPSGPTTSTNCVVRWAFSHANETEIARLGGPISTETSTPPSTSYPQPSGPFPIEWWAIGHGSVGFFTRNCGPIPTHRWAFLHAKSPGIPVTS